MNGIPFEDRLHKVVDGLRGLSAQEMNNIVHNARNRLFLHKNNGGLISRFEYQVATLLEKRYHAFARCSEREFVSRYLEPLRSTAIGLTDADPERIPFVIVIPNTLVPLEQQVFSLRYAGNGGEARINLHFLSNTHYEYRCPYLITDVDAGEKLAGRAPKDAERELERRERVPLTATEGVALATQYPELLTERYFDLIGSRYHGGFVPTLELHDRRPTISRWTETAVSEGQWGAPSCRQRITI